MKAAIPILLSALLTLVQQSSTPLIPVGRGRVSAIYDVRADGRYLYALERGVLHVVDATNPKALREVGALEFERPRVRIALRPPYLYLNGFNEYLGVIDISEPTRPRFVGDLPELGASASDGFELDNDVAYLIRREPQPGNSGALHFDVLDLSKDPRKPERRGTLDLGVRIAGEYGGMAHADGKVYVLLTRRPGGPARSSLIVVDVRQPATPRIERTLLFPEGKLYRDIEVRGDVAYVLQMESPQNRAAGLAVYRLPESGELELLGEAITSDLFIPIDLIVRGEVVYATFKGGGLVGTFDVSDPRAPKITNIYRQRDAWAAGLGMQLVDNRLYVAGDNAASPILDVTQPKAPSLLGRYEFGGGSVYDVQLDGNLAVLSSMTDVLLFDVTDPRSPRAAGRYAAIPSHDPREYEFGMVVAAAQGRAVVGFEGRPTHIIDYSAAAKPKLLATYTPRGAVRAALLGSNYAALGYEARQPNGGGGIEYVDLTDAAHPRLLTALDLGRPVRKLVRRRDRIIVAHPDGGVSIVDARDPTRSVVQGQLAGDSTAKMGPPHLAASDDGNLAYLTRTDLRSGTTARLTVVDLKEPSRPRAIAHLSFPIAGTTETPVVVQGSRVLILGGGSGGVVTVDARDPAQPVLASVRPLPVGVFAEGLAVDTAHLFVAASEDGLLLFTQSRAQR